MTAQILVKDQILLKDSLEIWKLRRGDGPGGEVGSSSKVSLWLQLEIDTEDFMNQYIIIVSSAQCSPCKASVLVSFLLTLWD